MVHIKKKRKRSLMDRGVRPQGHQCQEGTADLGRTGSNQEACVVFSSLPAEESSALLLGALQDSWTLT